jgi:hypothetical protein
MRPGEIFGLKWVNLEPPYAEVRQRVYRGDIDSPKSPKSIRRALLAQASSLILCSGGRCARRPLMVECSLPRIPGLHSARDNVWRRHIGPKLQAVGLAWLNFQVLWRSCSSLMSDQGVDGKVVADQLGHTLDLNQNVYTAGLGLIGKNGRSTGSIHCSRCG